jgi:stage II sporulation protein D
MRRFLTGGVVVLVVVLLALPAAMGLVARPAPAPLPPKVVAGSAPGPELKIRVYFPDTKQVQELPLDEYLVGVVAAEMPPEFHDEALKAQFVVARTYAVRRMRQFQGKGGCPLSPDADVCADPKTSQAYVTKEAYAKAHGASAAEQLWQRLTQLGQQTAEQVLRYHGEFIDPLYHAISGTVTEDSGSYFPQSLPYLKSVNDHWASIAPPEVMNATERRTPETLAEALSRVGKQVAVPALAGAVKSGQEPVVIVDRTPTGRVKTVKVLGVTLSGRDFRDALGLKSTNFTVSLDKGSLVIRTTGNGHGVGMSQWGANGMAEAGKSYKEILTYYYTGVDVSQIYDE